MKDMRPEEQVIEPPIEEAAKIFDWEDFSDASFVAEEDCQDCD